MEVTGKIIGGLGRASRLGYPTFNIERTININGGVYAGVAHFVGSTYQALIFVDTRRNIIESHLLDFDTQEREPTILLSIGQKIRETKQFPHDSELIAQLERDVETVRAITQADAE